MSRSDRTRNQRAVPRNSPRSPEILLRSRGGVGRGGGGLRAGGLFTSPGGESDRGGPRIRWRGGGLCWAQRDRVATSQARPVLLVGPGRSRGCGTPSGPASAELSFAMHDKIARAALTLDAINVLLDQSPRMGLVITKVIVELTEATRYRVRGPGIAVPELEMVSLQRASFVARPRLSTAPRSATERRSLWPIRTAKSPSRSESN
jgi:hypothetical protein